MSCAEQLLFEKIKTDNGIQFNYVWLDRRKDSSRPLFEIPSETLEDAPLRQTNYRPKIAQRYVTVALLKEAKSINPRDAKVEIKPKREAIDIRVKVSMTKSRKRIDTPTTDSTKRLRRIPLPTLLYAIYHAV